MFAQSKTQAVKLLLGAAQRMSICHMHAQLAKQHWVRVQAVLGCRSTAAHAVNVWPPVVVLHLQTLERFRTLGGPLDNPMQLLGDDYQPGAGAFDGINEPSALQVVAPMKTETSE